MKIASKLLLIASCALINTSCMQEQAASPPSVSNMAPSSSPHIQGQIPTNNPESMKTTLPYVGENVPKTMKDTLTDVAAKVRELALVKITTASPPDGAIIGSYIFSDDSAASTRATNPVNPRQEGFQATRERLRNPPDGMSISITTCNSEDEVMKRRNQDLRPINPARIGSYKGINMVQYLPYNNVVFIIGLNIIEINPTDRAKPLIPRVMDVLISKLPPQSMPVK